MNDDHPRHVLVMEDGTQRAWHHDCHAAKGCELCIITNTGAEALIGDEFRQHLLDDAVEIAAAAEALTDDQKATAFGTAD